jgi:hypothetical protein
MSLLEDLQHLRALLAIDKTIEVAKAHLAATDTGATLAAQFKQQQPITEQAKTALAKAQAAQHDVEMQIETLEKKTDEVNKKLYGGTVTGSRELMNLQAEIEMFGRQKADLEEKLLAAMLATEQAQGVADAEEATLHQTADDYRVVRAHYKAVEAETAKTIATCEPERTKAALPVSVGLLGRYDAIRAKKQGIGAAVIEPDETCGACHIRLNSNLVNMARGGTEIAFCEHCGRIVIP